MNNEEQKNGSASRENRTTVQPLPDQSSSKLAFTLVVIMLAALFILAGALLVFPTYATVDDKMLEYYKWAFSVLIGAFGAWIGAGAAHFFGRENLAESSRSTEMALRIQQEGLRGPPRVDMIKDAAFTAMNKDFMFRPDAKKSDVLAGLKQHVDYWFVPVLDGTGNGTLEDVIHSRVFWESTFKDDDLLSKIISDLDTVPGLKDFKKLHGPGFFLKVSPGDKVSEVYDSMGKTGAVVGVVVDDKVKPAYCFTKIDLQNLLSAQK
jgi:hypothetical protein